jgi:hypothetical protein
VLAIWESTFGAKASVDALVAKLDSMKKAKNFMDNFGPSCLNLGENMEARNYHKIGTSKVLCCNKNSS